MKRWRGVVGWLMLSPFLVIIACAVYEAARELVEDLRARPTDVLLALVVVVVGMTYPGAALSLVRSRGKP